MDLGLGIPAFAMCRVWLPRWDISAARNWYNLHVRFGILLWHRCEAIIIEEHRCPSEAYRAASPKEGCCDIARPCLGNRPRVVLYEFHHCGHHSSVLGCLEVVSHVSAYVTQGLTCCLVHFTFRVFHPLYGIIFLLSGFSTLNHSTAILCMQLPHCCHESVQGCPCNGPLQCTLWGTGVLHLSVG